MSKYICKYIATFHYVNNTLLVLPATSGGVSIASFVTVIGATVGITSTSLVLIFSTSNRIVKKFLITEKKYSKVFLLARSKLCSMANVVSKALIDN